MKIFNLRSTSKSISAGVKVRANVGDDFQQETKYSRNISLGWSLNWEKKPEIYKSYPNCKTVKLPTQLREVITSFSETLRERKSIRNFSSEQMRKGDLTFLLWASTGIQRRERGFDFRTAPSAGALYPIETYLAVNNVEDTETGLYHYNIRDNSLEEIEKGNFGVSIAHAALDQPMCTVAPVVFIWTAIFNRSKWKYSQRAYRYIYLDAGHVAQNLALAATSINCGSCQVGAFFDDEVNSLIGLDGVEESAVYLCAVGHPK
ncbi:MAG TPA: SagB/ThcOx family dehydrogenase [Candidatus Nanoarchaeia archaeon]|nr:SagB/ThcOx family dehydrogenase [Candidatus Nanoarchaeia archaeon]